MNKKLIALAVAGAMAGPAIAAAADVEVYGQGRISFGITGNDNPTDDEADSHMTITSHSSRLGFKGSEDLGDGLTAVYQIEGEVDLDDDADTSLTSRDSFVGLAGGFGTVLLGRHDVPYKLATKSADVWSDTYADLDGSALNKTHNDRADNVLAYISPDLGGFTVIGAYVTDIADDDLSAGDSEDEQSAISLAVMGDVGPVAASLAYQTVDNIDIAGDLESADAIKLGLGYSMDVASVNFVYEMTEAGDWEQDNIALTGSFNVSDSTAIKAVYGLRGEQSFNGDIDDSEGSFVALGVSTKLSKNVEAYALYAAVDNDDNAGAGSGVNTLAASAAKLSDGPEALGDDGSEASAIAVGINVKFSSK